MTNLLNQLVGLCAGRGALLRLERRRLLEGFKSLPDNFEYKDEYIPDCQLCMDVVSATANSGNNPQRRSSLKPWEQPNHGIAFRHGPHISQSDESVETFDPYELFRIRPIPIHMRDHHAQQLQNFTIPPASSREHTTSFPSIVMSAPSVLFRSNPYKIGRSYQNPVKRVTHTNSNEIPSSLQKGNKISPAVTDSHRFHTPAIIRHKDTSIDLQRHSTTSVFLDNFEADMRILTDKLIRQEILGVRLYCQDQRIDNESELRWMLPGASQEELEQARGVDDFSSGTRTIASISRSGKG